MKQDSTFSSGLEAAERQRRAEGVHHAEPAGRARGQASGELHGAAAAERLQPGRQRRLRGAGPAGQRAHPGHRQRPVLRHREAPDHRGLRGELAVRRRGRGADRLVVQAVHAGHRAGAGGAVRLPADRADTGQPDRLHELRGRAGRDLPRWSTTQRRRRARSPCTRPPPSR